MADKKPKRPMTEEQLERLAEARKKALEIRKANQAKRLQNKMDNLKYNGDGSLKEETALSKEQLEENIEEEQLEPKPLKENIEEKPVKAEPVKEEEKVKQNVEEKQVEEEEEVVVKKKAKPKKKQVVIVEQSSSDSDEFEPNQSVLFVRRVSKNKKQLPEPTPAPQEYVPPPVRREPQRPPQKTKQELMYNDMFSGAFLNNQFGRRF